MHYLKHVILTACACFLILVVPLWKTGYLETLMGGEEPDAVSSPSVILDQPSGKYVIYLNHDRHPDEGKWNTWLDFFQGKEISYIFEDISCLVARTDPLGYEMARSCQSRLPENQMKLRQEDAVLMLSRAEYGKYDIIIMSKEAADIYHAERLEKLPGTEVLTVNSAGDVSALQA